MAQPYAVANLSEIAHPEWPYWAPIRHEFDVRSFGVNAWRGDEGDEVVKRHTEGDGGHEELYVVLSGHATFEIDSDEIDAPAGTYLHIADPTLERAAVAHEAGTVVLSLGGWPDKPFQVSQWEADSFAE
jgi:hypothetical protein